MEVFMIQKLHINTKKVLAHLAMFTVEKASKWLYCCFRLMAIAPEPLTAAGNVND